MIHFDEQFDLSGLFGSVQYPTDCDRATARHYRFDVIGRATVRILDYIPAMILWIVVVAHLRREQEDTEKTRTREFCIADCDIDLIGRSGEGVGVARKHHRRRRLLVE